VIFGVRKTALLIAPFFVLPFFVWVAMARAGVLSAWRPGMYTLSATLAGLGAWIDCIIMRRPEEMSRSENHISWKLIYLMAMVAYAGLALAYMVPWRD
jgi:hypothetical protein